MQFICSRRHGRRRPSLEVASMCLVGQGERVELCTRYSGYSGRHLRHSAFSVTSWFNCHSRPFEWIGFWILLCWLEVALTSRLSK